MTQKQLFLKKISNYSIEKGKLLSCEFKNFIDGKFDDHNEIVNFLEDNLIYINSFLICHEYYSETEHCDVIASIPQEKDNICDDYEKNKNINYTNSEDNFLINKKAEISIKTDNSFDITKITEKIKKYHLNEENENVYKKEIIEKEDNLNDDKEKEIENNLSTNETNNTKKSFNINKEDNTENNLNINKENNINNLENNNSLKNQKSEQNSSFSEIEYTEPGTVKIIKSYNIASKKHEVNDFVRYFINRYKIISGYLRKRSDMGNHLSISIINKQPADTDVSLIGIVKEISETRNKNIMLTMEDLTGEIRVIFNKKNKKTLEKIKNMIVDEIVGIKGVYKKDIMFGSDIIFPDIPYTKDFRKCDDDVLMVVLSDVHVGSTYFMEKEFEKFIKWVKGEVGGEKQKETSKKIKYIVIVGDLVDGVGIYPKQKDELTIPDIYEQYKKFTEYLKQIPEHIQIVICPGNHDALRIAEPQPPIPKNVCPDLYDMPNVYMVSSPSYVNLHSSENFPGFDVLMYHGYSFDYYYTNVESLRNMGAMHKPHLISRFLLQKRHLAPSHTSTLYIPDAEDSLIIQRIPDFLITGHIHTPGVINYRNTTIISGSCFQAQTDFQVKVGHEPEPCKIPIVNLKTRKVKILKFVVDEE